MLSFKISVAVVATALFSLSARAQKTYTIDPSSVPILTREGWCSSQQSACPLICLQLPGVTTTTTDANSCNATTLTYSCICSNGQAPNASEYSQTLPYFICTEYGDECVANCNGDSTCQSACRADNPCGAQNPVRSNATTTSSTSTATGDASGTSTSGVVYNGLGGSATTTASSNSKSGSQMTLDFGRSYGLAVVFAGLFAGFALVM